MLTEHTDINKTDFEVMFHAQRSFLFLSNQHWVKRDSGTFYVTTRADDDAEIYELMGTFMLSLLNKNYNSNNIDIMMIVFFFNWDSLRARLNSHYKTWSYKKKKHKKIKAYRKSH